MDITEKNLLRFGMQNIYAKSVNILMTNLSKDYFLHLKVKRLVSPHLIQGESIELCMYVRSYLTIFTGKNWVLLNSVQERQFGCFWPFSFVYTISWDLLSFYYHVQEYICLKNVIRQIDSKNEWLFLLAIFTAKFLLVLS